MQHKILELYPSSVHFFDSKNILGLRPSEPKMDVLTSPPGSGSPQWDIYIYTKLRHEQTCNAPRGSAQDMVPRPAQEWVETKVKSPLCSTKHHDMQTYGGVQV
jgi:hypothetical protein